MLGIEAPSSLGALPRSTAGQRYFQPTTVLGKRKRSELAVATDGERIDIFDIGNNTRLASYSVPSDQWFTCPPCSVSNGRKRYTYIAGKDEHRNVLLAFEEDETPSFASSNAQGEFASRISRKSIELSRANFPVQSLHAIPYEDSGLFRHTVLRVGANGSIGITSEDLTTELHSTNISNFVTFPTEELNVEYAAVLPSDEASKSIFKDWENFTGLQNWDGNAILCLYFTSKKRKGKGNHESLYFLRVHHPADTTEKQPSSLTPLMDPIAVPKVSGGDSSEKMSIHFDFQSGMLLKNRQSSVQKFDITKLLGGSPGVSVLDFGKFGTSRSLNSEIIVGVLESELVIHELTYGSLQSSLKLLDSESSPKMDVKSDSKNNALSAIDFVASFPKESLIVGVWNDQLLSVHISGIQNAQVKKAETKPNFSLIDSIGKGNISRKRKSELISGNLSIRRLSPTTWKFFDRMRTTVLEATDPASQSTTEALLDEVLNDFGFDKPEDTQNAFEIIRSPTPVIDSLIKKCFRVRESIEGHGNQEPENDLEFLDIPLPIYDWLLRFGGLTVARIEKVLTGQNTGHSPGWFTQSLVGFDPSYSILSETLHSPMVLDSDEILYATKMLMESLGFTNIVPAFDMDVDLEGKDLDEGEEVALQLQQEAASRDLDIAIAALETGTQIREQALTAALVRLSGYDTLIVASSLARVFSKSDLVDMIHMLRMQLQKGGWLISYDQPVEDGILEVDQQLEHESILVICKVIDCALKCIGLGVSAFENSYDQYGRMTNDLVAALQAEISAVLGSVHATTYLKGIIDQLNLFGPKTGDSSTNIQLALPAPESSSLLPLTTRDEKTIAKTKLLLGGKSKRLTVSEKRLMRSMLVPKYSFDRIVF